LSSGRGQARGHWMRVRYSTCCTACFRKEGGRAGAPPPTDSG
jgi:hypothetical protein